MALVSWVPSTWKRCGAWGVQVVALCDLPERVAVAAARHGIPQAFGDYRELLRSPDIDAVHIASSNRFHCEMSLAALAAGKHCVCEKPLAMTTRETAEIVVLARRTRTVFAVNDNVRFYPAVLQLRKLVAAGALGEIIAESKPAAFTNSSARTSGMPCGTSAPGNTPGSAWIRACAWRRAIRWACRA